MSIRSCNFIISRGRNKGKRCGDVNKYCRNPNHRAAGCNPLMPVDPEKTRLILKRPLPKSTLEFEGLGLETGLETGLDHDPSADPIAEPIADPIAEPGDKKTVEERLREMESRVDHLEEHPSMVLNQVFVLLPKDDYVQVLEKKLGSREAAYLYLEQCVTRHMVGDIELFEQIYLKDRATGAVGESLYPPFIPDAAGKGHDLMIITDQGELVSDPSGLYTIQTYCGNSQEAYIEAMTDKIAKGIKSRISPDELQDDARLQLCMARAAELSNPAYQRRLLGELIRSVNESMGESGETVDIPTELIIQQSQQIQRVRQMIRLITPTGTLPPLDHYRAPLNSGGAAVAGGGAAGGGGGT